MNRPRRRHKHAVPAWGLIYAAIAIAIVCGVLASSTKALIGTPNVNDVAAAITELDVEEARHLIARMHDDTPALAFERARLAIYTGDCDGAAAILSTLEGTQEVRDLSELAKSCAKATAASVVIDDTKNGVWLRLQDDTDRALVPFLTEVVAEARASVERDFGLRMPRPLRVDLVRDLFSLSAVSGLSVRAAETTGTVAVARWGRVTMLSPRAAALGYSWEDTLAHEITHLALSRATRDHAPLWLQEGLAKREETRWRPPRPFDRTPRPEAVARSALENGESVGVDALGPSIAMLPTPRAASIAFAEVQSFIEYLVTKKGTAALHLLLMDLRGLGEEGANAALRSVTGFDLQGWIVLWQHDLRAEPSPPPDVTEPTLSALHPREVARAVRLGDLLFGRGAYAQAAASYRDALRGDERDPAVRWRLGRALIASGQTKDAVPFFRSANDVAAAHAGWYALSGRLLASSGDVAASKTAFVLAIANHPYLEDAACEGHFRSPPQNTDPPLPADPTVRALCEAARKVPRD